MAVEYQYDSNKEILYITIRSYIEIQDIENTLAYIMNSSECPPDVKTLWDIRPASLENINMAEQEKAINIRKKFPQRGKAKIAVVADNDLAFGLARMYEQVSAELPQKMQVFKNIKSAEKWLLDGS